MNTLLLSTGATKKVAGLILSLAAAIVIFSAFPFEASAQAVNVKLRAQMGYGAYGYSGIYETATPSTFTSLSQWSPWAYHESGDPTSAKFSLIGGVADNLHNFDIRFCIQAASHTANSQVQNYRSTVYEPSMSDPACTPWASEGGGWSDFVTDQLAQGSNGKTSHVRLGVEARPMPVGAPLLKGIQLGAQAAMLESSDFNLCPGLNYSETAYGFPARYTAATTYTQTAGAPVSALHVPYEAGNKRPDCYRLKLVTTQIPRPAEGTAQFGIQAHRSDSGAAGTPVTSTGSWSAWASTPGNADIDRARVFVNYTPSLTDRKDFRFCLRVSHTTNTENAGSAGYAAGPSAPCTPWASDAANNPNSSFSSPFAHAISGTRVNSQGDRVVVLVADPNYLQIRTETRPMPGNSYLTDLKINLVAGNGGNGHNPQSPIYDDYATYCNASGVTATTDWSSLMPLWSSWATNSTDNEPDCYALSISAKKQEIPTATATIQTLYGNTPVSTFYEETPGQGASIKIRWSSENATSCTGTGPNFSTGGATSGEVTLNASVGQYTYSVSCVGAEGGQTWQQYSGGNPINAGSGWCSAHPQGQNFSCPSMTPEGASCPTLNAACQTVVNGGSSPYACTSVPNYYRCSPAGAQAQVAVAVEPLDPEPLPLNLVANVSPISFTSYGEQVTISGSITNTGTQDMVLSGDGTIYHVIEICSQDTYYCGIGYLSDSIDVTTNRINAGQTVPVSGSYTFPEPEEGAMPYHVRVCANPNQYANESSYEDNCSAWQSVLPQAVLSLSVNPFIVKSGNGTTFTWSAENVQPNLCTIRAVTGGGGPDYYVNPNGETSGTWESDGLTARSDWYLECWDLTDSLVESERVEVRILPGVSEF